MKALREPLWWLIALFIGLLAGLPYSAPLFSRLFPELPRPVYQQESFWALTLDHGWLVVASSLAATAIGLGAGVAVTRPAGGAFRPLVETIAAIGQTLSAGGGAGDGESRVNRREPCRGGHCPPAPFAAVEQRPGGYGIRPYGCRGRCSSSTRKLPLTHTSCGRAMLAPTECKTRPRGSK